LGSNHFDKISKLTTIDVCASDDQEGFYLFSFTLFLFEWQIVQNRKGSSSNNDQLFLKEKFPFSHDNINDTFGLSFFSFSICCMHIMIS
jgi:hypothetical protein